ncbi:MAG: amino acid permease [Candidatus Marinimicrobia bacterium]|mgnify:CR=1 FL=1|jgi:APA family basic amino acid/polyamine antiporter|nr:amino acid permease [Candidatus Neomarinimicrobiota bacterium]|tara:strand:+ start:15419 stop:16738 length:1320 start_codon:yes stop_codon:yes gene_type:complete
MAQLKRSLGLTDGIALLVGITIGSGIFATPQIIAGYLDSFSTIIILWIGVAGFVFVGALIYGELGSRFPNTGGEYVYIQKAFGPFWGFLFGWAQLFIIRTSPAAGLSLITANYIGYFIPIDQTVKILIAIGVIVIFGYLNYLGVERASYYNKFSSATKIAGLFLFVLIGLIIINGDFGRLSIQEHPTAVLGPIGNTVAALILILFSFIGWDRVGYVAGEMKNPTKEIPQSMLIGMLVIIVLYLGTNILYHSVIGIDAMRMSTIVASDTAVHLFGTIGAGLISLMVIISATGSINGTIMSASRVYYAMARDGLLFNWLNHIHPKFQTPTHAIIAHCTWGIVLILVRQNFETIVAGMVFAILIFYGFTTVAFFKFRTEDTGNPDGYRLPYYPLLPGIYLAGIIVLVILRAWYEWDKSLQDLAFVFSGIPVYFIWFRSKHIQ